MAIEKLSTDWHLIAMKTMLEKIEGKKKGLSCKRHKDIIIEFMNMENI